MSLSSHPRHIVHARAPYSVGLWRSPSLRAKQPCHASVDRSDGGHLWLLPIIVILLIMKTRHCISGCGRVKQPCHADVGLCAGGHLLLHAGVPLRFTTCLKSYRPYGAPLPHPTLSRNGIASRHREERSDPFMTDLCKIYFPKKHFISNHLPDSKRLQSTTNV